MTKATLKEKYKVDSPRYNEEWKDLVDAQGEECSKNINEPRYLLTVYQKGDERLSGGDWERKEPPRRYYVPNASLKDVKEHIVMIDNPHWHHPNIKTHLAEDIPFEEKRWSIIYDFDIEPMTKELEDSYVDGVKSGFFKKYRRIYGNRKSQLDTKQVEKNFEEGFEKDTFIIEYVEGSKVSED